MLDRETRREKILSALNKEARLKSKAKSKMKMMMDSGVMKKVGGNFISSKVHFKMKLCFRWEKKKITQQQKWLKIDSLNY